MLQLPSAWNTFIAENTTGASCLGQLSGLEDRKEVYKNAVATLTDKTQTTLFLVSRPEDSPLKEVERSSNELSDLGIETQHLIINGVLENYDVDDSISKQIYERQQNALNNRSTALLKLNTYIVPLRSYNMTGIDNIRNMLNADVTIKNEVPNLEKGNFNTIDNVIEDLYKTGKRVIFTMGKGGVGKTTIAGNIARGLAQRGVKVHLTTTDPANHLSFIDDGY